MDVHWVSIEGYLSAALTGVVHRLRMRRASRLGAGGHMNRWFAIVGGVSLNLALGSLYAWSVFVLPLEKEFGWNRAQTSWVYTIAIVCFAATFIAAGSCRTPRARGSAR